MLSFFAPLTLDVSIFFLKGFEAMLRNCDARGSGSVLGSIL